MSPRAARGRFRVVLVPPLHAEGMLPLAAGLLKAAALRDPFLRARAEIVILEPSAAPEEVPARVAALRPDLAGFTIYGDIETARAAAAAVKELCGARIVFGGPMAGAVPPAALLAGGAVDYAVEGEAEESFPALLRALLGEGALGAVKGLSYSDGGRAVSNPPSRPPRDLASLPSPYLGGLFKWRGYERAPFEMSRGCRESCLYCSISRDYRRFPFSRVRAELARILKDFPRARTLFLTDPDICLSADMAPLLRLLAGEASRRGVTVEIQVNPRYLEAGMAGLLNDRAFSLGVGVQSVFPAACRGVKRHLDLAGLERGLGLLGARAPRSRAVLSFIIGLPGDTYADCLGNFDWGLARNAGLYFHRLRVYPNSPLGRLRDKGGLKFRPYDPYHVTSVPSLPAAGLRKALRLARELALPANIIHADKYFGFLFRYVAAGLPAGGFPRVALCRRLNRLLRADKGMAAAAAETDAFRDEGDWSGLAAGSFEARRPRLIRALAALEKGGAARRAFAARYAEFCGARLAWEGVDGAVLGRILELAGGRRPGPALLVSGSASSDTARLAGLKPSVELLVEEKFGFFPAGPARGRRVFADRPRLAEDAAAALAGAGKFSTIVVSQVFGALPPADRARFLKSLLARAGYGARLFIVDSGLGCPEFGRDWELTGGWLACGAAETEGALKSSGWRPVRAVPLGKWRVFCAERA